METSRMRRVGLISAVWIFVVALVPDTATATSMEPQPCTCDQWQNAASEGVNECLFAPNGPCAWVEYCFYEPETEDVHFGFSCYWAPNPSECFQQLQPDDCTEP